MKRLLTLIVGLLPLAGMGQNWEQIDCEDLPTSFVCGEYGYIPAYGDTMNPVDHPAFFSSDTVGVWQFGHSYKAEFDSVSTFVGWVTDTILDYPQSTRSWFEINLNIWGHAVWIMFEHKYATDTLIDGGYVEFWRDGQWNYLSADNATTEPYAEGIHIYNYVGLPTDTLSMIHDSIPAFTGQSSEWEWSGFEFFDGGPVFQGEEYRNETSPGGDFRIRFVFESDSVDVATGGWMIRNIVIGAHNLGSSVSENQYQPLDIYPNPTASTIRIQLPEGASKTTQTTVFDMTGRLVHQQTFASDMDVAFLSTGSYVVIVQTEDGNYRGIVQKE